MTQKPTAAQSFTIAKPKPIPRSTESWWLDRGREGFTQEGQRRATEHGALPVRRKEPSDE